MENTIKQYIHDNITNKNGILHFANQNVIDLAKKYGTPVYLMDEDKIRNAETDALMHAILSIQTEEEAYCFFEDLCTSAELKALSQRLVVAKMLTEKKVYTEIVKETGASTATISRVKRSLFDNDTYGYSLVLDKINGKA